MMNKAWCCLEEVPCCFSRSSVRFQDHTAQKIVNFDPNWAFPDCNSSLNLPMATKWCTKLEVAQKRCLIVFQGHLSNFKVTQLKKKSSIGGFRTETPLWIHQWQRNDAQSLEQHKKGCPIVFYGSAEGPPRVVENRNLLSHPDDLRKEAYLIRMT